MTFDKMEKLDISKVENKDEHANLIKPSPTHSEQYKKPLPFMSVESEFSKSNIDIEVDVENVDFEHRSDAKEPPPK